MQAESYTKCYNPTITDSEIDNLTIKGFEPTDDRQIRMERYAVDILIAGMAKTGPPIEFTHTSEYCVKYAQKIMELVEEKCKPS
jgi:hypothetical protein